MQFSFTKYHGTGNDFIIIDNRNSFFEKSNNEAIMNLCCRRFGIGADGLILLEESEDYDFFMRYFNSDGQESTMCGNGGRCIVAFARELGIIDNEATFLAMDGIHSATIMQSNILISMQNVTKIEKIEDDFLLDTGSPHYVKIINKCKSINVVSSGRSIRNSERFRKSGVNVNFLSFHNANIYVHTYERGVEDETYSCGTGVVASAIVAGIITGKTSHTIITKGGTLNVSYDMLKNTFTNIILGGPATKIFEGSIII